MSRPTVLRMLGPVAVVAAALGVLLSPTAGSASGDRLSLTAPSTSDARVLGVADRPQAVLVASGEREQRTVVGLRDGTSAVLPAASLLLVVLATGLWLLSRGITARPARAGRTARGPPGLLSPA